MFLYQCKSKDTSHEEAFASPVHLVTPIHLDHDDDHDEHHDQHDKYDHHDLDHLFRAKTFTDVLFSEGVFGPQPSPSITLTKTSVG